MPTIVHSFQAAFRRQFVQEPVRRGVRQDDDLLPRDLPAQVPMRQATPLPGHRDQVVRRLRQQVVGEGLHPQRPVGAIVEKRDPGPGTCIPRQGPLLEDPGGFDVVRAKSVEEMHRPPSEGDPEYPGAFPGDRRIVETGVDDGRVQAEEKAHASRDLDVFPEETWISREGSLPARVGIPGEDGPGSPSGSHLRKEGVIPAVAGDHDSPRGDAVGTALRRRRPGDPPITSK